MFRSNCLVLGVSAAVVMAIGAATAHAQGIVNGGFESGATQEGWPAEGWQVSGYAEDAGYWWCTVRQDGSATEGSSYVRLYAHVETTAPGMTTYTNVDMLSIPFLASAGDLLQFDFRASTSPPGVGSGVSMPSIGAYVDGAGLPTTLYIPLATGDDWATLSTPLPASGNYTLGFQDHIMHWNCDHGDYAMLDVDNVRLTSVPEPSTLLLAAGGLVGLLACHQRRRR
jgi:hypothetical protein